MILKHKGFYQQFVDIHIVQKVCCYIFFIHKIAIFLLQKLNINWNEHPLPLPITMILTLRLNTISFKELVFFTLSNPDTFTMWSLLLHGLNFTVYVNKMVSNFFFSLSYLKLIIVSYDLLSTFSSFPYPGNRLKKFRKKKKPKARKVTSFYF